MLCVIDIDGTIANGERRFKIAGPEPERSNKESYEKWVELVNTGIENDDSVAGMSELCNILNMAYSLLYLTSREEKLRSITEKWLRVNGFSCSILEMRPNGCYDSASLLKERIIKTHRVQDEDVIVIDDDEHGSIEDMCKRNGWTFLKARSGGQR